jgi:hypothetical protein
MVTRTGVLSDKYFETNCLEYQALPIGFFNSTFRIPSKNPSSGDESSRKSKYPPQPAQRITPLELAFSLSKFMTGNRNDNTELILKKIESKVKDYVDVPIVPSPSMEDPSPSMGDPSPASSDLSKASTNLAERRGSTSRESSAMMRLKEKFVDVFERADSTPRESFQTMRLKAQLNNKDSMRLKAQLNKLNNEEKLNNEDYK